MFYFALSASCTNLRLCILRAHLSSACNESCSIARCACQHDMQHYRSSNGAVAVATSHQPQFMMTYTCAPSQLCMVLVHACRDRTSPCGRLHLETLRMRAHASLQPKHSLACSAQEHGGAAITWHAFLDQTFHLDTACSPITRVSATAARTPGSLLI